MKLILTNEIHIHIHIKKTFILFFVDFYFVSCSGGFDKIALFFFFLVKRIIFSNRLFCISVCKFRIESCRAVSLFFHQENYFYCLSFCVLTVH